MIIKKTVTDLNCECLRPDVEIQGDCTPPVIEVDTVDNNVSYENLLNKPRVNGVVVKGDHNGDYYGLVDKTTEPNQVYTTDKDGLPSTVPYSEDADPEHIVRRDENGDVIVPLEPGKDDAATSKKYVDDAIDEVLTKAVVFKGVLNNQTELPTEGNRNGDMYWIKEFVEPVPPGMLAGHTGTAIYNGTLQEWQFEKDEIYDPDEQTIILNSEGKLAVQLSQEEYNNIEVKDDGLYISLHGIEEDLAEEIARATAAEEAIAHDLEQESERAQQAENDLDDKIEAETERAESVEGELENLTTDDKNNLVAAINEVDSNLDTHIADYNNPHQTTISKLDDTTISSAQNNDFLLYSGTLSKWINFQLTEIDGGHAGSSPIPPTPIPDSPSGGDSSTTTFAYTMNGGDSTNF